MDILKDKEFIEGAIRDKVRQAFSNVKYDKEDKSNSQDDLDRAS